MPVSDIFKRVWYEAGLTSIGYPSGDPVASSDTTTLTIIEAIRRGVRKRVIPAHEWRALTVEKSFATLAQEAQDNSALEITEVDRFIIGSPWDESSRRPITGPVSNMEWRAITKAQLPTGVFGVIYFVRDGKSWVAHVYPVPAADLTFSFSYVSRKWVTRYVASDWVDDDDFSAGTDNSLLSEDLVSAAGAVEALDMFGEDSQKKEAEFEQLMAREISRDGGRRIRRVGYSDDDEPMFGTNTGTNVVVP